MANLYKTNGEVLEVIPKNGTDFSLEELQCFVGGYIELVNLNDDEIMIVNEEGKLDNLPYNQKATEHLLAKVNGFDVIVGDALVCKRKEVR